MLLVPYSTDAPIYHFPFGTIGMIVANVVFFFVFCVDGSHLDKPVGFEGGYESPSELFEFDENPEVFEIEAFDPSKPIGYEGPRDEDGNDLAEDESGDFYALDGVMFERSQALGRKLVLDYGHGLRPWQWFTSPLMHADIIHLIGNMIFLWSFGLIIEGKIGLIFFLLLYNGIGATQSLIEQTLMLFSDGGVSLGTSSAIFGLLALVVVWAPVNEFSVLLLIVVRPLVFEMPHMVFGFIYVLLNALSWYVEGTIASTGGLHMMGFLVGFPAGMFLLHQGFVDCEGYDLISYFQGKEGRASKVGKAQAKKRRKKKLQKEKSSELVEQKPAVSHESLQRQVQEAIDQGQLDAAVKLQNLLSAKYPGLTWRAEDLKKVISGYLKANRFNDAAQLIEIHVSMFEEGRFGMQANLAKIWLKQERPRHTLRYMKQIDAAALKASEREVFGKLVAVAKKQIADGVVEF